MKQATKPQKRVRTRAGRMAAIAGTMLAGLILAILTDTDSIPLISRSEANIPETASAPEERPARLAAEAARREAHHNIMAACQARRNADPAPDVCRPSDQHRQKLLVLLALWRVIP